MNQLTDTLTVAGEHAVHALDDSHGFDRVLSVGYSPNQRPAASTDDLAFPDGAHDYSDFEAAVDTVVAALDAGETVLVHCQAGISRSPTVCATALATRRGIPFRAALADVQQARPLAAPLPALKRSARRYLSD
jgi:predicted protein tyrosine phosphatase